MRDKYAYISLLCNSELTGQILIKYFMREGDAILVELYLWDFYIFMRDTQWLHPFFICSLWASIRWVSMVGSGVKSSSGYVRGLTSSMVLCGSITVWSHIASLLVSLMFAQSQSLILPPSLM